MPEHSAVSTSPQPLQLTLEQERAVVANDKLLLIAISALSQWTLKHITTTYRISEAECVALLAQLDRLGILSCAHTTATASKWAKVFGDPMAL